MAKKEETKVEVLQLEPTDVAVLFTLASQATIKVTDIDTVSGVLNKCRTILAANNNQKNV